MSSIVKELADWTKANGATLSSRGVQVTENFPRQDSPHPWKASIWLVYEEILVSFTVWERTILQTELLVNNAKTKKTLVMDEKTPNDAALIRADLDVVVQRLLSGVYARAKPDPKLLIS
jgi:hypothetical protein